MTVHWFLKNEELRSLETSVPYLKYEGEGGEGLFPVICFTLYHIKEFSNNISTPPPSDIYICLGNY